MKQVFVNATVFVMLLFGGVFILRSTVYTPIRASATALNNPVVAIGPREPVKIPVLMYHYVEYVNDPRDTTRKRLNIRPDIFEEQVKTLKDAGYTFLTAQEIGRILDGTMTAPEKSVALTFDDGHWDIDTTVLPILKKYKVHATIYVISGFIGESDFVSQSQLQDVINSGLVEVGAHTVHHAHLTKVSLPVVEEEVAGSKKMLEDVYHVPVVSFAYPDGAFSEETIDVVKKAGFTTAVSTIEGNEVTQNNRYYINRLRPGHRTGQELISYIEVSR